MDEQQLQRIATLADEQGPQASLRLGMVIGVCFARDITITDEIVELALQVKDLSLFLASLRGPNERTRTKSNDSGRNPKR